MKALVVDDSRLMRRILARVLGAMAYEVVQAASVKEAIERLDEEDQIDLITLDWNMPGWNGPRLLEELQTREDHPDCRVIMLTSQADPASIEEAMDKGATGFISKPFDPGGLEGQIRALLAGE